MMKLFNFLLKESMTNQHLNNPFMENLEQSIEYGMLLS